MGKGGSGIEKGRRLQCRKTHRRTGAPGSGSRVVVAGSGDAVQASPLGRQPVMAAGSMTCSTSCVMSQDIEDTPDCALGSGFLAFAGCCRCGSGGSASGLVVAGWVEGEVAE